MNNLEELGRILNEYHSQFREICFKFNSYSSYIYHCSNRDAIRSILKTGILRLTKVSDISGDKKDSIHYLEHLKEKITDQKNVCYESVNNLLEYRSISNDFYIFCAARKSNLDRHFHEYANQKQGYALRMDWRKLTKGILRFQQENQNPNDGYFPCGATAIHYADVNVENRIAALLIISVKSMQEVICHYDDNNTDVKNSLQFWFETYLQLLCALSKPAKYQWENEMRYFFHASPQTSSLVKTQNNKRFIEFPWLQYAPDALTGIIVGQGISTNDAKAELLPFLSEPHYHRVKLIF